MGKRFALALLLAVVSWTGMPGEIVYADRFIPADTEAIQYFGRWDMTAPGQVRTGRGAVYLRVDFTGTFLKLRLKDTQNWWRYTIDGKEYTKFKPQAEETLLADNLPPGRHQLFLIRCTEGRFGVSVLEGLDIDDQAEVMKAAAPSERRIEIVGDSIAAGAMNDGPQGLSYLNKEDGSVAFAPELARQLGAEWSVVAKSGEGVVHNYEESWPANGIHTQDTYGRTFYTEAKPVWNSGQFPPQVILITMGTNDFSDADRKPTQQSFVAGYEEIIRVVRHMNPDAVIIGVEPVPVMIGPDAGIWVRQAVEAMCSAGDKKLYFIPVNVNGPLLQDTDYVGDGTHPTVAGARKIADYLRGPVAAIMGWE